MRKPNAADVYYFIERNISKSQNEGQIISCSKLIDSARIQGYAFVGRLCDLLQVQRVWLIAERYPVAE